MSDFGDKNHVNVDVEHKFIREFEVTDAAVHDSQVVPEIFDHDDSGKAFTRAVPTSAKRFQRTWQRPDDRTASTKKGIGTSR